MTAALPLIGIPCFHDKSRGYGNNPTNAQYDAYLAAISRAGGLPFLIPLSLETAALRQLYDVAAGILLTGGGDIDPVLYRQTPQATLYNVQPDRDHMEITLSRWAADEGKPVLAICRGIQVMAVAAGGNLCQDISSQMPEATQHIYLYNQEGGNADDYLAHQVKLTPSCRLAQILQTNTFWVNSLHHQAVQHVPEPLQIMGYSSDGVVEVVEHASHPFFCGVQWHPELLPDMPESQRIFEAFVRACRPKYD
jgi:putative glutamine amidotransferase